MECDILTAGEATGPAGVRFSVRTVVDMNARMVGIPIFGVSGRRIGTVTSSKVDSSCRIKASCTFLPEVPQVVIEQGLEKGHLFFVPLWEGPPVVRDKADGTSWIVEPVVLRGISLQVQRP